MRACPNPNARSRRSRFLATSLAAAFAGILLFATFAAAQVAYVNRVADGNRVGLTVTNYGYLGNNFTSRDPSMEFPRGSGLEHLPHGGLWIGGQSVDSSGAFTGVTTAELDGSIGGGSQTSTEFTPLGNFIEIRSNLLSSPDYSPSAVSALDLVSAFHDSLPKRADNSGENHRPLRIRVRQESYQFTNTPIQDAVFLHYVITATGPAVTNAWVGLYLEFASGDKRASLVWPPSGWFNKKWLQYDETQRLIREHYCASSPAPAACQLQRVPYWVGAAVLTPPNPSLDQHVTLSAWRYSRGSSLRDQDTERYALMSTGLIQSLQGDSLQPGTGDPAELIAIGPYPSIGTGDSIVVDFALVGGAEVADIQTTATIAQQFQASGFDGVVPTQIALAESRTEVGLATLDWYSAADVGAMMVERSAGGGAWSAIATISADGAGHLRYDDRDVVAGERYGYRLVANGTTFAETWVTVPVAELAVFGLGANPARAGELNVDFALGTSVPASLELFDVAGRRLAALSVGSLGAGRHVVDLAAGSRVQAGVYFVRLAQGGRSVGSRMVVMD